MNRPGMGGRAAAQSAARIAVPPTGGPELQPTSPLSPGNLIIGLMGYDWKPEEPISRNLL